MPSAQHRSAPDVEAMEQARGETGLRRGSGRNRHPSALTKSWLEPAGNTTIRVHAGNYREVAS